MSGIANRLKNALHLDAKAGGAPIPEEQGGSQTYNSASSGVGLGGNQSSGGAGSGTPYNSASTGLGANQSSGGVGSGTTPATSAGAGGMQSGGIQSSSSTPGTTGDLQKTGGVGAPTGRPGELRTGQATGGTIPATTIASTGIPTGSEMPLPDRSTLILSEEHWDKAEAATQEARRQAQLVEQGSRSHAEATEEYFHAEREFTRKQHYVEEIETKLRNLGLESKQKRLAESRAAYEAEKGRLLGLYGTTEQLRSKADAAQDAVNEKGHELEARVQESKLYSDRLAALEADLEDARLAEQEARDRHARHQTDLEPLANKHRHHKSERDRIAAQLESMQGAINAYRQREAEAARKLDGMRGDHESVGAELTELEAAANRKEAEAAAHLADLNKLRSQREQLGGLLGQHRQAVSEMTKDTQDTMARAQAQSDAADAQAAELARTKEQVAATEADTAKNREALSLAVAESRALEGNARNAAGNVETYAQQASALEAELRAAKERVDLAQARKEELWEVAKSEGAAGEQQSNTHYVKNVAEPAGDNPEPMINKTGQTETLAGKIQYGADKILHHQKDGTVQQPPQV